MDKILAEIISELFINLSAGWFGAALIIPIQVTKPRKVKLNLLTLNVGLGIVFVLAAYGIKKIV